eukprot:gnl/MRDRNA2_/MRDRNA2_79727_c0_seq2.p1 gnl/MRDRNA2_/MRDRNA2_79727_c0~~gnl/MRDRNA2_/MRDRNA2_79727_c0_seq2.p1  ORF type:complete len:373 (-),score=51.04 gnl/MRDRNA2_/MRDRNA2_79727_c0_seq2:102-1220(-)
MPHQRVQEEDCYYNEGHHSRLTIFNMAAVANILSMRDPKSRLQVVHPTDQSKGRDPMPVIEPLGELNVGPVYEWYALRVPQLTVRPGMRVTPLARVGTAFGVGPPCPPPALCQSASQGFRFGIAFEFEATKKNQRKGREWVSGKQVRGWLVSWLPCLDNGDIALILTFWPRGIHLTENLKPPGYQAIVLGNALKIEFPKDQPLEPNELSKLLVLHKEVQRCLRVGYCNIQELPFMRALRAWSSRNLTNIKVEALEADNPEVIPDKWKEYNHRRGFGAISWTTECCQPEKAIEVEVTPPVQTVVAKNGNFCTAPMLVSRKPTSPLWQPQAQATVPAEPRKRPSPKISVEGWESHQLWAPPPFDVEFIRSPARY